MQGLTQRDVGKDFPFASLLHPLPPKAFGVSMRVCSVSVHSLSLPFIAAALMDECDVEIDVNTAANVLWEIANLSAIGSG